MGNEAWLEVIFGKERDNMEKNIYEKVNEVKKRLLEANIKKSGVNKFAGYNYYELADFTPFIINFCTELKLFTAVSFNKELATLTIVNAEKPDEKIEYTSPIEELELKGCNKVQALGGTETYSRRYLYMAAFDIIENDMFDSVVHEEDIGEKKLDKIKLKTIQDLAIDPDEGRKVLQEFGYEKSTDIKVKDYAKIFAKLKELL